MKINLKKIVSYQIETKKGPVLFEKVSAWNGMIELKDREGRKIIAAVDTPAFGGFFREYGFVHSDETAVIVMADPAFAAELVAAAE